MRSFSKKLAFVLAAAMVVTSFAPAAKAEAAKEMAINKSSQILYVNEGINHKGGDVAEAGKGNVSVYDFSVKNKPADWKDTLSFKWSTSDDEIATVKAGGVVTAVGVGKATITCKVTDKATKETVATLKTKVTVKANADAVEITNPEDADGLAFAVGSTVDLNRAMYDEDGNRTTKRGKYVTDYTRWVAVPDTGVDVDDATGKFTFTEPGEYELYCETYQSSKYTKTTAKSDSVFVTITKDLEFKQTSLKKFDILLGTATDITAADVTVEEVVVGTAGEYRVAALIKGVTLSDDKKTATVESYYDFKDGVTYEVTVKGYDKAAFVASAGEPVAMYVWAMDSYYKPVVAGQVTIGKTAELKYTLIDANGVDVTTENDTEKNKVRFNLKYVSKAGASYDTSYYAGYAKFKFIETGDSAVVEATYTTLKDGKEVKVTAPATNFYGVARQLVIVKGVVDYTTNGDYYSATKDMIKLTKNSDLSVKLELIDGKKVDITTQDQKIVDAEDITNSCWITVETAKSSKDLIDVYANAVGQKLTLHPRKAGLAQLMVYYNVRLSDGSIMKTAIAPLNVKVADAPILGAVNLNWSGAPKTVVKSIEPSEGHEGLNEETVFVQIKDQYGDDYPADKIAAKKIEGNDAEAEKLVNSGIKFVGNDIVIDASKFRDRIYAMNPDALNRNEIFGVFTFTVKVQDKANWQWKTNEIIVDIRGKDTDGTPYVGTDHDRDTTVSGNIARFNHYDPWNVRNQKYVQFHVFQKMNGANIEYVNLTPWTDDIDINTATAGYYYRLFKDGNNVTTDRIKDGTLSQPWGHLVNFNYSTYKTENGKTIVSYDNVGAGSYRFEVYNVQPSEYDKDQNVVYLESNAVRTANVTCDPGHYTLTGRKNVIIKNSTGKVPATLDDLAILKCFDFVNRGGVGYDEYSAKNAKKSTENGKTTLGKIDFYGNVVDFHVEINPELSQPNSVYVDYITFYEKLDGQQIEVTKTVNGKETKVKEDVYAAYRVEVDCYVEFQKNK